MLIPFGILSASAGAVVSRVGIAGYAAMGQFSNGVQNGAVDKILFANDTVSTLATGASLARYVASGFSNSGVAGYLAGGGNSAIRRTTVYKFAFPADTRTTLGTGLSTATGGPMGFANSGVAGYSAGGETPTYVTTVDKFAFPGDTRSTLGTGLSGVRAFGATAENTLVAGYYGGGDANGSQATNVDKFAFPSDTRSTLASGLVAGAWYGSVGFSNDAVAIYFQDNASTTMTKYAMPTDTRSSFTTGAAQNFGSCQSNAGLAGYISGGGSPLTTAIQKISYSNDSRSTLSATLSFSTNGQAPMSNQGVF